MKLPDPVKERIGGGLWAGAWMWPLISPMVAIARGQVHPAGWAAAAMLAFIVLYLVLVTNAFDDRRPKAKRTDYAMLAVFSAIGVTMLVAFGDGPADWLDIMLYVAVCGAALLEAKYAAAWVISSAGLLVGYALSGPSPHLPISDLAQIVFGMMLASALVHVVKQMMRYNRILRSTRAQLARTAVSEERLRFSRDLHDLLGHTLSLIVVKAEIVRKLADRDAEAVAREARDIETIGRKALTEVRETVNGYREPQFATELEGARSALRDAGIAVRVQEDDTALPGSVDGLFGWAVREASTNVIRHSQARACTIAVRVASTTATLDVCDDGIGTRPDFPTGTGLLGLRERVTAVGGTVATDSSTGSGFRLVVTVPLPCAGTDPGGIPIMRDGIHVEGDTCIETDALTSHTAADGVS